MLVFVEGLAASQGVVTLFVVTGLYSLAVMIPSMAVSFRRLHDTNRSGWGVLSFFLVVLVPFIGDIVLLVFMVQDSQPNENQYGSNPKAATAIVA